MSNIKMGKSGALQVTNVAAARALMTHDLVAGYRETPDVGVPLVKVTVHAPMVAEVIERRKHVAIRQDS